MLKKLSLLMLLSCLLFGACQEPVVNEPSAIDRSREALAEAVNKLGIQGEFAFQAMEDGDQLTTIYKNKAIGKQVEMNEDGTLILGLYTEKKSAEEALVVYQTRLVRKGSNLALEITDLANNVINRQDRPIPPIDDFETPPVGYDSFEDCLDDFYCNEFPALQCEANETCETIITGKLCCLKDGTCAWFDFIHIKPTDPKCKFIINVLEPPVLVAKY